MTGISVETLDERVQRLAERTNGAYSFRRYSIKEWRRCVRMLLLNGFDEREAQVLLSSKIMRWVADAHPTPTAEDVEEYLNSKLIVPGFSAKKGFVRAIDDAL